MIWQTNKMLTFLIRFLPKNSTHRAQLIFFNHLTGTNVSVPQTVLVVLCFGSRRTRNLYCNKFRHMLNIVCWLLQYYIAKRGNFYLFFQSSPVHSIPFHSSPFHSIPVHSIPFQSIPVQSSPPVLYSLCTPTEI